MSIEGQGHFFTIYFPGFVCFVLYKARISGEPLQDHWSSGLVFRVMDELHHEKTFFLRMRKQRRRLAVMLISAFVFVT